jgi:hypothetical protein
MAAAIGNNYAGKAKAYEGAIKRALVRRYGGIDDGLNAIADKLIEDAISGEYNEREKARREIADRLDGKAKQQIEASGPDGTPLVFTLTNDDANV